MQMKDYKVYMLITFLKMNVNFLNNKVLKNMLD